MVIKVEGDIYKVGTTKKGGYVLGLLVKRPDGQADAFTVFTDKSGFKAGQKFAGSVNVYVQMGSEV